MKKILWLVLAVISFPCPVVAGGRAIAVDDCVVVCPDKDVPKYKQLYSCWCWAASLQSIFDYHGLWMQQEEICKEVFGCIANLTANPAELKNAFDGKIWYDFLIHVCPQNIKNSELLCKAVIETGPVLVGFNGHAYVLTHIYCSANYEPMKVILINPRNAKEEIWEWRDFFKSLDTIVVIAIEHC